LVKPNLRTKLFCKTYL